MDLAKCSAGQAGEMPYIALTCDIQQQQHTIVLTVAQMCNSATNNVMQHMIAMMPRLK